MLGIAIAIMAVACLLISTWSYEIGKDDGRWEAVMEINAMEAHENKPYYYSVR